MRRSGSPVKEMRQGQDLQVRTSCYLAYLTAHAYRRDGTSEQLRHGLCNGPHIMISVHRKHINHLNTAFAA
jgi:hypothetical protein